MSNEYNDRIVEDIAQAAGEALAERAIKKFGTCCGEEAELWQDLEIRNGWFDRKVEELWQGYPEGPL